MRACFCFLSLVFLLQTVYVQDIPAPGQTIHGSSYATGFGGSPLSLPLGLD